MNVIDAAERFNRVGNNNAATGRNTTEAQNNDTLNTNQKENEQPTVNESEFTTRVNKKNQILSEALKALNSGDTSILPEEERQKLETKAPGYARVIQGRIDNIQNSITEENRTESEEKIKSLQNILNTTNGINNYFENKKQNEDQELDNVENTKQDTINTNENTLDNRATSEKITTETQQLIDMYQEYLDSNPEDYVFEGEYQEKTKKLEEIIEWLKNNKDKVPSTQSEIVDQALIKFQNYLNQFKKEQRKKIFSEIDTINNSYLTYAREINDIKENVEILIKRFNNNYEDYSYFKTRGRPQDSNEYEMDQNRILTQILDYVQNYADKYMKNLKEDLMVKIEASNKIPEEFRNDIGVQTYGFDEDFIKETMSSIERRISASMDDFNNTRVVDPYVASRINSKLEEIRETLRIFRN